MLSNTCISLLHKSNLFYMLIINTDIYIVIYHKLLLTYVLLIYTYQDYGNIQFLRESYKTYLPKVP